MLVMKLVDRGSIRVGIVKIFATMVEDHRLFRCLSAIFRVVFEVFFGSFTCIT